MSAKDITKLAVRRAIQVGYQRMFHDIAGLSEALYDRELFDIAADEFEKIDVVESFEGWYFGG